MPDRDASVVVMSSRTSCFARVATGVLLAAVVTTASSGLRANESGAVVLTSTSDVEVRVQLAEGLTTPCDSGNNRMLLDGRLPPGATFRTAIAGDCVCIRSTSASFPNSDWSTSGLKCRPRTCRGRVCRPAPDPTIYLSVP
jgi:hypothetical protein